MAWDRQTRGLSQRKQEKPQIKKHIPLKSEGNDGDISIRQLKDGVFLFFKALGKWYKTLNTSSQVIPEPDAPRSFTLGSSAQPVESMYVSSNSLHIGNTKSQQTKLSSDGSLLTFKDKAATSYDMLGSDESSQINFNIGAKNNSILLPAHANASIFKIIGTSNYLMSFVTNAAPYSTKFWQGVLIDKNAVETDGDAKGLEVDFDSDIDIGGGDTLENYGADINVTYSGTNSGTVNNTGINLQVVNTTDATTSNQAIKIRSSGADSGANYGISCRADAQHLRLISAADTGDYLDITVGTAGATTVATVDDGGTAANLTLDIDGALILDSAIGAFIMKGAGSVPEFSVANSSYAGMIIGYTVEGINQTPATYPLTLVDAIVASATHHVSFIAPPSTAVEIEVQIKYDAAGANNLLYLSLSDNTTIGSDSLPAYLEQLVTRPARFWDGPIIHKWVMTGLTAGTSYKWYLTAKVSSTTGAPKLMWGGDSRHEDAVFIMKATALPTAVADYAIYS